MAQTTVELRALLERTNFELFDFTYQVDDPAFKTELEQRIIDFYYDYEIGFETPELFKRKFKTRFLRAITYYNKLYNTTLLSYNPLINSKITEALEQLATATNTDENSSTVNSGSTNTSTQTNKTSDYPQQPIAGGDYLAGATDSTDNSTTDGTTTSTGNTKNTGTTNSSYTKTIEALTGTTYQDLIMKERETILRIPNMLIEELKPCFILTY